MLWAFIFSFGISLSLSIFFLSYLISYFWIPLHWKNIKKRRIKTTTETTKKKMRENQKMKKPYPTLKMSQTKSARFLWDHKKFVKADVATNEKISSRIECNTRETNDDDQRANHIYFVCHTLFYSIEHILRALYFSVHRSATWVSFYSTPIYILI